MRAIGIICIFVLVLSVSNASAPTNSNRSAVELRLISWQPKTAVAVLELRNRTRKDIQYLAPLFVFAKKPETIGNKIPNHSDGSVLMYTTRTLPAGRIIRLTTEQVESGSYIGIYVMYTPGSEQQIVWTRATVNGT